MLAEELEAVPGVGSSASSKLRVAGYPTIESLVVTPPQETVQKTELGLGTVLKIQEAARNLFTLPENLRGAHRMLDSQPQSPSVSSETQKIFLSIGRIFTANHK